MLFEDINISGRKCLLHWMQAPGVLLAGVPHTLEWNPGNHFTDADLRTARAFEWAIGNADN